MHEDEQDDFPVSKLLRLKRYEQPSPEYFQKFLCEFQQRQRSELLRRPAWRIALEQFRERIESLGFLSASQLSYAGASIAVLAVAGMVTLDILRHPGAGGSAVAVNGPALSQEEEVASVNTQPTQAAVSPPAYPIQGFAFNPQIPSTVQMQTAQPGATSQHPRYILDTRPASYEPPSSF